MQKGPKHCLIFPNSPLSGTGSGFEELFKKTTFGPRKNTKTFRDFAPPSPEHTPQEKLSRGLLFKEGTD